MNNVGDEHVVTQEIRVVKIHEETLTLDTLGGDRRIVRTGRFVTFIFRDYSEDAITLSEEAFALFLTKLPRNASGIALSRERYEELLEIEAMYEGLTT